MTSICCFAGNEIIDPTSISINSWEVYIGGRSPSLQYDQGEIEYSSQQWQSIVNYPVSYAHLPVRNTRWFRSSFVVGWHLKNSQLALSLGPLYADSEVFVNGVKLSELESNEPARSFRRAQTRIYHLPRQKIWYSFLDFQKENQILIYLSSNKEPLMLRPKQVEISSYGTLALKAKDSDTLIKIAQGGMIALLLSFCLFSIFMRAVGFKERENNLFGSYVICVAIGILSDSLLLPDRFGYWSAHSSLPHVFTTFSVLILVALLSPRQRLSDLAGLLLMLNLLVLACLSIEDLNSAAHPWLVLLSQIINAVIILHALLISFIGMEKRQLASSSILLTLVFVGWCIQFVWAYNYTPVQPLEITLFIAAIALLLNVAQRFKTMASSLLALSNRLVSIREKERARLTRDIHDGVGQGLSTLKLLINLNATKLESNLGDMLKTEVSNTSDTLKSVIRNLKPIEVTSGSPTQAIISLAQHNCRLSGINLNVLSKSDVELSQERAYQVYRIAQEALNNAIKHSNAEYITLSFEVIDRCYRVQITDDGEGLQGDVSGDTYGISSMSERSMILRAELSIESRETNGTTVLLEVPIND
ncbi:MAG: hypothetical protein HWE24_02295 [Oceanospirillaceae bacterium]|nr:hypothetical protein [Oceanospirillaceae bacterium]